MRLTFLRTGAFALAAAALMGGPAFADGPCPPGVPSQVSCGGPDMADITPGAYAIDPMHAAVIARIPHIGYSMSVFRFDTVSGTLDWNADNLSASSLKVEVDTGSIATNVPGFAKELSGPGFLKSEAFPKARFVSTGFRRKDSTHGWVDGQFTLMGKTVPATFDVALVGAGKGFGHPRMGVHASTTINPQDFGLPPTFDRPIELAIDVEFANTS